MLRRQPPGGTPLISKTPVASQLPARGVPRTTTRALGAGTPSASTTCPTIVPGGGGGGGRLSIIGLLSPSYSRPLERRTRRHPATINRAGALRQTLGTVLYRTDLTKHQPASEAIRYLLNLYIAT